MGEEARLEEGEVIKVRSVTTAFPSTQRRLARGVLNEAVAVARVLYVVERCEQVRYVSNEPREGRQIWKWLRTNACAGRHAQIGIPHDRRDRVCRTAGPSRYGGRCEIGPTAVPVARELPPGAAAVRVLDQCARTQCAL